MIHSQNTQLTAFSREISFIDQNLDFFQTKRKRFIAIQSDLTVLFNLFKQIQYDYQSYGKNIKNIDHFANYEKSFTQLTKKCRDLFSQFDPLSYPFDHIEQGFWEDKHCMLLKELTEEIKNLYSVLLPSTKKEIQKKPSEYTEFTEYHENSTEHLKKRVKLFNSIVKEKKHHRKKIPGPKVTSPRNKSYKKIGNKDCAAKNIYSSFGQRASISLPTLPLIEEMEKEEELQRRDSCSNSMHSRIMI